MTLARAWLDIVRRSMARLDVAVEIAPDAQDARLPALVLLSLVQHAIDGAPPDGAGLTITCEVRAGRLRLALATSSASFGEHAAPSLAPLLERLHALYADRASLRTARTASGSWAELDLPFESSTELAPA